jgi:hypothetical protein
LIGPPRGRMLLAPDQAMQEGGKQLPEGLKGVLVLADEALAAR